MKNNYLTNSLLIIIATLLVGCTMSKITGRAPKPVYLNTPNENYEVIGHFNEQTSMCFDYTSAADISDSISNKISRDNADAIVNLAVKVEITPMDILANIFTIGIANCRTMTAEGDTVKIVGSR